MAFRFAQIGTYWQDDDSDAGGGDISALVELKEGCCGVRIA